MAKQNHKKNANNGTANGRSQSFLLAAPKAASVQLVGDFAQWQQKPISMRLAPVWMPPSRHQAWEGLAK
jgi:1,4-alpha-glucan branching enzyme